MTDATTTTSTTPTGAITAIPSFDDLLVERQGPVVRLTLHRPAVTNALSIALSGHLHETFDRIRASEEIKVVVITGAGGNFCAGDDLSEMSTGRWGDPNQVMRLVRQYQDMANTLEELDKVTIAAVEGNCVGGGLEITMACDFVICAESSRWGMPEVDWGITPGWGGTTRMARLIGRRMTKEINLLGALHPARRGLELGLFNRVVPDGDLVAATDELVDLLLIKNQQGLRQLKFMINKNVEADLYTAQGFEALGAALTSSLVMGQRVPDADTVHGWASYRGGEGDHPSRRRREASIGFWVD